MYLIIVKQTKYYYVLEPKARTPGSKMTISGRPEIGLEDVPWTLAAHRMDVLRTSVDPKTVQILTEIFKTSLTLCCATILAFSNIESGIRKFGVKFEIEIY